MELDREAMHTYAHPMSEAWDRRLKLLHYLMRKGYTQTADAARYLDTERRTARADLEALAQHGVPLYPSTEDTRDRERTWELARSWRMTGLEVKLLERLALLLGKEVLEPLLGSSELGSAMAQLEHELGAVADGVETSDQELLRRFYLVQEPSKDYRDRGALISDLVDAIAFAHRVTITYRSPNANAPRTHARLRPLTLAIYRRGLYVFVAFDNGRHAALSIDRITSLTPHHTDTFEYPTRGRWDPAAFLRRRFGLTPGDGKPETVRLRFPAESKVYALEREWMPDQIVEPRPDGGVDIVFEAEGAELAHRVLEWGGYCEVIEPPALRRRVLELARAVVRRHEGG